MHYTSIYVANRYGVSNATVCLWIERGLLEGEKIGAHLYRVSAKALATFDKKLK